MDAPTVETDAARHRLRQRVGWIFASLSVLISFTLWGLYRFIGDTTPLGEAVTTIPPIVWLAPLSIFILPALLVRSWRARRLVIIGMLLLFLEDDVRSLLYWSQSWHHKTGLRVATWNIAGQSDWNSILGSLEAWNPDIVFLQETPDGNSSLTTGTLSGYWEGFHWWDQGDCGILCRYPMASLPSGKIGPWDKPALALADVSRIEGLSTKTIVLCSVRLMMPVNAIYPGVVPSVKDHGTRTRQYTALATLLMEQQQKYEADAIIVGGDFNVRGNSRSLRPLWNAGLSDVWNTSGRGWGATILSDFPVARIDHIYTEGLKRSTQSAAVAGKGSDHRLVLSEIPF